MKQSNKQTALYCRVATNDDGMGGAIASQRLQLEQFAEENGYANITLYMDDGYSGINYGRPAFTALQKAILDGKIETILVTNLSRIGRDYLSVMRWMQDMVLAGVEIVDISNQDHPFPMLTMDTLLALSQEGGEHE